jgi:hypothetical protein
MSSNALAFSSHYAHVGRSKMSGFAYFYRTYTAAVSGSVLKRVRCTGCSSEYSYELRRTALGGGHSPFFLNNSGAALAADQRARANLARALDQDVEPVFCPVCGLYQPDMVALLRKRLGPKCDPNKYSSVRASVPVETAWREVRSANEISLYEKFIDIWPAHSGRAEERIRELKHPQLRNAASLLIWGLWGAAVVAAALPLVASHLGETGDPRGLPSKAFRAPGPLRMDLRFYAGWSSGFH